MVEVWLFELQVSVWHVQMFNDYTNADHGLLGAFIPTMNQLDLFLLWSQALKCGWALFFWIDNVGDVPLCFQVLSSLLIKIPQAFSQVEAGG